MDKQGIAPVFNGLSYRDRAALFSAASMNAATGIMREDVEARPWLYPLYILPAISMTVPGGFVVWLPVLSYLVKTAEPCTEALFSAAADTLGTAGTLAIAVPALALTGKLCADYAAPWTGKVKDRMLASVFNKSALVDNYKIHIAEDTARPGCYKVDKSTLTKESMKISARDLQCATLSTWQSLQRLLHLTP